MTVASLLLSMAEVLFFGILGAAFVALLAAAVANGIDFFRRGRR